MLNRLSFRLALPLVIGVLLLGGFLSVFVLDSIARFASERAERDLAGLSREAAEILSDSYDHLVLSGTWLSP